MATIYVVTAGEYSDYHIVAATTSKEHAKKIVELHNKEERWCDAEIEVYEDSKEYQMPLWSVNFDRLGNAYYADAQYDVKEEKVIVAKDHFFPGAYDVEVTVRAKDKETAIKAAAERRAKVLAEKEGL